MSSANRGYELVPVAILTIIIAICLAGSAIIDKSELRDRTKELESCLKNVTIMIGELKGDLEKHAADGIARVDYALAMDGGGRGGRVLKHSEPYIFDGDDRFRWITPRVHPDAYKMLKPSFGEPGQCFALKGSSGFVVVRLRNAIFPEAVTLEHVAPRVTYNRRSSSAPKDCQVSGWLAGGHNDNGYHLEVGMKDRFFLADFAYDLDKSSVQTFNVSDYAASKLVDTVRFDFTSNHGDPKYTCIYRLRVHGHESDSAAAA